MRLIAIPDDKYDGYRHDVIFKAYKWDPQFLDNNTIARHVLLISDEEHAKLERLTELLEKETVSAEQMLCKNLKLSKPLAIPRQTRKELWRMKDYQSSKHIRLMRFDFHQIEGGGWAISEVNSDAPGGFAEASLMTKFAAGLFGDKDYWFVDFGEILANAIAEKAGQGGRVMFVHCTSYSDDRQVMQFLGDKLEGMGLHVVYAAADHLRFESGKAISVLDGNVGEVHAIFRFTPLEWLTPLRPKRWHGYFDTTTPSCNHPVAIFAQTKRFPLVWDALEKQGVPLPTWRALLPQTLEVKDPGGKPGYIFKPAFGRVGEGISIKEACREDEFEKIIKDVKKRPKQYVAQKRFDSMPLISDDGESFHVCLGSFCVNGKPAGYYARMSKTPRIDSGAADIPVLVCQGA